jgi:hypothetical protein
MQASANFLVFFVCATLLATMAKPKASKTSKTEPPIIHQQIWVPNKIRSKYSPCTSPGADGAVDNFRIVV